MLMKLIPTLFLRYTQEHTFCYSDTLGVSQGRQRSRVSLNLKYFFEDFFGGEATRCHGHGQFYESFM